MEDIQAMGTLVTVYDTKGSPLNQDNPIILH